MKNIMLVFLIGSILLFGCTQSTTDKTGDNMDNSMDTGDNMEDTGDSMNDTTQDSGDNMEDTGDSMNGTVDSNGGTGGSNDLLGKSFAELSVLGIPLQCDITASIEGQTTNTKVYMKGDDEVRSEVDITVSSGCDQFVYIMKNGKVYMGCEEGEVFGDIAMFEGCNWIEFEKQEGTVEGSESSYSYSASTPDFGSVPDSDISCVPWLYDASKFDTPGKICNIEEIMSQQGTTFP